MDTLHKGDNDDDNNKKIIIIHKQDKSSLYKEMCSAQNRQSVNTYIMYVDRNFNQYTTIIRNQHQTQPIYVTYIIVATIKYVICIVCV
jgi:hypothetical protein